MIRRVLIAVYCLVGLSVMGQSQSTTGPMVCRHSNRIDPSILAGMTQDLFEPSTEMSPEQVAQVVGEIFHLYSEKYCGKEVPAELADKVMQIYELYDLTQIHPHNCNKSNYFGYAKDLRELYEDNMNIVRFIDEFSTRQVARCREHQPDFVPSDRFDGTEGTD